MSLLLGLDQGSTKTHAVIVTQSGEILGAGSALGALHTADGMNAALERMHEACTLALSNAGCTPADIEWASGGITGIDYPHEENLLQSAISARFGLHTENIFVGNDCLGALWGGTFHAPAVVCCVGTGLAVGGTNEAGRACAFGNYCNGYYQGGSSIGQDALQHVFDAAIGLSSKTSLTQKILAFVHAKTVDELLLLRYRKKAVQPSKLCPLVFEAAEEGDVVAISILETFARRWGEITLCMIDALGLSRNAPVEVILSGSVFKGIPDIPYRVIRNLLHEHAPNAVLREAIYEPVVGGTAMGLFRIGQGDWRAALAASADRLQLRRTLAHAD